MTGAELRALRESVRLTRADCCAETGTPYRTWEDWEAGRAKTPGLAEAWLRLRIMTFDRAFDAYKQELAGNNDNSPPH